MKTPAAFLLLGALGALVAGGVGLSARLDSTPLASEAAAAAIRAEFAWYSDAASKIAARGGAKPEVVTLCIAAKGLDFRLLAARLSGAHLRPVPVAQCSSKTLAGDPGMENAATTWVDAKGKPAAMITLRRIRCETRTRCSVDLDFLMGGNTYDTERRANGWTVTASRMRWVV